MGAVQQERAAGRMGAKICSTELPKRVFRGPQANDVRLLAALLAVPAAEIASRAGVSTPVPKEAPSDAARLAELDARLARVEHTLAEIKALLLDMPRKSS